MGVVGIIGHLDLGIDRHISTHFSCFMIQGTNRKLCCLFLVLVRMIMCMALMVAWITIFGFESSFCYECLIRLIKKAVKVTYCYGLFGCGWCTWRVCWTGISDIIIISHHLDLCIISCIYPNELFYGVGHNQCLCLWFCFCYYWCLFECIHLLD